MQIRATVRLRNEAMLSSREMLGLSQTQLAEQCGLTQGYISRLERLDYPQELQYERVVLIANALGLTVDDIFPEKMQGWRGQTEFHKRTEMTCEQLIESDRTERYTLPDPSEIAEGHDEIESIKGLLHLLTPRQHRTITLRYGLDDGKPLSVSESSKKMGIQRSAVTQLEGNALRKIARLLSKRNPE